MTKEEFKALKVGQCYKIRNSIIKIESISMTRYDIFYYFKEIYFDKNEPNIITPFCNNFVKNGHFHAKLVELSNLDKIKLL